MVHVKAKCVSNLRTNIEKSFTWVKRGGEINGGGIWSNGMKYQEHREWNIARRVVEKEFQNGQA